MSLEFPSTLEKPSNITPLPGNFVRPAFEKLYGFDAPQEPPKTFTTATLTATDSTARTVDNTYTLTIQPSASLSVGSSISINGLTSSDTGDNSSLTVGGSGAAIFGSSGEWTQSTGVLVLTVASGQSLPTGSDTVVTFIIANPNTVSVGVTGITSTSSGFTTADISGTFLNTVDTFNVTTRNTEANIGASTPTNPTGEVNIAFGTDTDDFYIYDGSDWYIFNNDS